MNNIGNLLVILLMSISNYALAMIKDHNKLVRNSPLSYEEAVEVAGLMVNSWNILSLDLRGCSLGAQEISIVASALQLNNRLQELELSNNPIGDEGMRSLGDLLKDHRQLQVLRIDSCDIGDAGAWILISALAQNTTLKKLSIAHNPMHKSLKKKAVKTLQNKSEINYKKLFK
jgi:Ran GTPase-activating protein (RanGAP) involved in mRNA processing and transport